MNNNDFLLSTKRSFLKYLKTSARSNEKLKILHGTISHDLQCRLGDGYDVFSLGKSDKELDIQGRYINKKVDITITEYGTPIAGIAVKFVMSNYQQNSNNYFENMLGETANIRSANIPYFQIFIIPEMIPYYDREHNIKRWEFIDRNYLSKYVKLSEDNVDSFYHTPNKTLISILKIDPSGLSCMKTAGDYRDYYLNNKFSVGFSDCSYNFSRGVVYNDYENFIKKVEYTIKSL